VNLTTGTGATEFLQFQLAGGGFFVFGGTVVFAFTLSTLKVDNVTHGGLPY
jgi:hypothetical protein